MSQDPEIRYLHDQDAASFSESAVADGINRDGSEHLAQDRDGPDGRVSSADAFPDGKVNDRVEGGGPNRDRSEDRVAARLVERLNQLGENWNRPELENADARSERGVDCVADDRSGSDKLLIQVTSTEREIWGRREPVHERYAQQSEVVEAIHAAIAAKATRADRNIVLALDAIDSPRAAFRSVADAFRKLYGVWAADVGFKAIWLVGPSVGLVHRLDAQD